MTNSYKERHRRFRDFTPDRLKEALREIVACFTIYRMRISAMLKSFPVAIMELEGAESL